MIDGLAVSQLTFPAAMKFLKEKLRSTSKAFSTRTTPQRLQRHQNRIAKTFQRSARLSSAKQEQEEKSKLVLTFRTLEERMRQVRIKATRKRHDPATPKARNARTDGGAHLELTTPEQGWRPRLNSHNEISLPKDEMVLRVDMKMLQNSICAIVRPQDSLHMPFRIENRSVHYTIFYRQRGCDAHGWNELRPGETKFYTWEEPMRAKKLSVKAGFDSLLHYLAGQSGKNSMHSVTFQSQTDGSYSKDMVGERGMFSKVQNEEQGGLGPLRSIKLEEIGFSEQLPCPSDFQSPEKSLQCQVDTEGATRVLIISDFGSPKDELGTMALNIENLQQQMNHEGIMAKEVDRLRNEMEAIESNSVEGGQHPDMTINDNDGDANEHHLSLPLLPVLEEGDPDAEHKANTLDSVSMSDRDAEAVLKSVHELRKLPEHLAITSCNQVLVEVIEVAGLTVSSVSGFCNPYCEIIFKGDPSNKRAIFKNQPRRRTHYIEKTLSPKWTNQVFVFDVPHEAAHQCHGYSIQVRLRNFSLVRQDGFMGQADIPLRTLRNQKELEGWYPLVGRQTGRDLDASDVGWRRGSVKLRLHWIHTNSALLTYFLLISEHRMVKLASSLQGMQGQYARVQEAERERKDFIESIVRTSRKRKNLTLKAARRQIQDVLRKGEQIMSKQPLNHSSDQGTRRSILKVTLRRTKSLVFERESKATALSVTSKGRSADDNLLTVKSPSTTMILRDDGTVSGSSRDQQAGFDRQATQKLSGSLIDSSSHHKKVYSVQLHNEDEDSSTGSVSNHY